MMRKAMTVAVAVAASLALVTGCGGDNGDNGDKSTGTAAQAPAQAPAPTTPASTDPSPSVSEPPSGSPTGSASPAPASPTPTTTAAPKPQKLKVGAKGPKVLALQQRLTELGYWNGKADGKFGGTTQQAVFALQKAAGLGRDGTVGPKTQKALDDGVRPKARSKTGSGYLVEINKKTQLLMLVKDGTVVATLNTSTGSNQHYEYEGDTYLADTPSGHFKVGRQIDGMRHGPLGDLWRPKYFNGGIAVHGNGSVPPYAASHGCARVSNAAMNWIWATDKIPLKTKVWVY